MSGTIASLALVKVNWDSLGRDHLESFVPFIATLMSRKNYRWVERDKIREDFEAEYGLLIPHHAMRAILDRAWRRGYFKKVLGKYAPVREKVVADDFSRRAGELERKHRSVIKRFVTFCGEEAGLMFSDEEADDIFIAFLRDHDLDMLFAADERSTVLPETHVSGSGRFLICRFVADAYENDAETFGFVVDMSMGHIIANTLLCRSFDGLQGALDESTFYLDVGFLFGLTGTSSVQEREACLEFVQALSVDGARVCVFRHTYEEFVGILESCLQWIERGSYDPLKANRALTYFVENEFSGSDVERIIIGVDGDLAALGIEVVGTPGPLVGEAYQIDEDILQETIVDVYRERVRYFDAEERSQTLVRDVRSIAAICKLRKGCRPRRLDEARHVFVTSNSGLAYASRVFETRGLGQDHFSIPAVLTDVFVGTLVWIRSPAAARIGEKRLIANCYAALQPTRALLTKLVEAADRLREEGTISDEEVTLLKESRVARNLLQRQTLGEPERFTARTAIEVLEEIRRDVKAEAVEEFFEKRKMLEAEAGEARAAREQALVKLEAARSYGEELLKMRDSEDERAERYVKRLVRLFAGGVVGWYVVLVVLVVWLGWETMEPWMAFVGPAGVVGAGLYYLYLAVTLREFSWKALRGELVKWRKRKNYERVGLDVSKLEGLRD